MSTIITRNSATSGSQPSSLVQGELAINVTDGKLFYGSGSGNVVKEFTAISASYALTASYVNPLRQTVQLTGSLNVTGSTTQIGNNTLAGNTTLSGSIIISGSTTVPATPTIKIYGDVETNGVIKFDPVVKNIDTSLSASYIYVSGSTNDLYFSQNGSGYNNVTRLRWLEGNLYTGLLHGGLITTQSSTVYQVSSGSGVIVNLNASLTNDPFPTIQFLQWPNLSASIAPLSASFDQSFVSINSSTSITAQGTPYQDGQYNTLIPIGIVVHQNHSTINAVQTFPSVGYGWKQRSYDFIKAFGPLKIAGYDLSPSGSSTGSLVLSGGTSWVDGRNYTIDPNNPSYIVEANGITTSKIYRYYQSGSEWNYLTNGGAGYGAIDPTQYALSGSLTPVNTNHWTIQRVFYFPNSATKAFYIYYGNAEYANKADAIAGLLTEPFNEAPNTAANAIFVGYMILRHNANFTTAASYEFRPAGLFRGSGAGGAGGGGGTTSPAGANTQIQYNNAGAFGATGSFAFIPSSQSLQQGNNVIASGLYSHAEGSQTYTHGVYSHAEGLSTQAGRNNGYLATAAVAGNIVLDSTYGDLTTAGLFGPGYIAAVDDSAYDDNHTYATISVLSCSFDGTNTHVYTTTAINTTTLIVASLTQQLLNAGTYTWGGLAAHSEGNSSISTGIYAHSEGNGLAYGGTSHAEGSGYAIGDGTHAEGGATAVGNYSHAEGQGVTYAGWAHAEGSAQAGYLALSPNTPITAGVFELNPAYGDLTSTFSAGQFVLINDNSGQINGIASTYLFEIASSTYNATPATAITLVDTTVATINDKFEVGVYGYALPPGVTLSQEGIGTLSHAEGESTQAIGRASHTSGYETRALGWYQLSAGQFNQPISTPGAFIVGDGFDDTTRHNLLVAASGSVTISGSLLVSGSIIGTTTTASYVTSIVKGEATINFGSTPGGNYTTTTVSTPYVTNNSNIHIYIMSTASADHNKMDHQMAALYSVVMPDNIIDNTSFDIVALSQLRLDGTFKVRYTINNN